MTLLRALSLVFALAAAGGLVVGSVSMTGGVAYRDVHVNVVDDEHAFIGFDSHQVNPNKVTVFITNRYRKNLKVTVSAESTVTKIISVGKRKAFSLRVDCAANATAYQLVTVEASQLGKSQTFATIERTIELPPCTDGEGTPESKTNSSS